MPTLIDTFYIFGAKYLFVLSFIIAGIYFLRQPRELKKKMLLSGLTSLIVIFCLALLAGVLYNNPRPFVIEHFTPLIPHAPDNGFPSDHTLLTSAIASVIFFYNKKVGLLLLCISIIVGLSRVYVGVHHPIDIIASIIISFVGTSLVYIFLKRHSQ
jgi:undecaprenyl-diphosphatase